LSTTWTADQIVALAPGRQRGADGQGLAAPRKWVTLGAARPRWGECQGSGAQPYRTAIDLSGPAFKCTCPSRKLPCKHSLGLFLMLGRATRRLQADRTAAWGGRLVAGPSAGRSLLRRSTPAQERRAGRSSSASAAWPPAARPGSLAQGWRARRLRRCKASPRRFWEGQAARLVDAQAPVCPAVRRWPPRLLRAKVEPSGCTPDSRLYLLLQA